MNMASDVTRVRASRVWLSAVAIALLLVVSNPAPATAQSTATVMVSNLGEAEYARIWLNPGQAYAHSFHTGNTAVTLEKVRLHLRGAESTPAVTIRADNSGQPYRSLQALTNPSIDSSIDTYEDFTAAGYVLAANTTYWVVFHRQWGSKPFSFSVTLSETGSDNRWCNDLGTPDDPYTSREDGWSLGENLFFGLGSRWREASFGCWSMRMAVYAQTGQGQSSNSPATGGPGITGTVGAGETLTATTDLIEDEDGLTGATFTYQWLVDGAEINGATDSTYIVIAADEGKPIEVRVAFTDDAGNPESLTSNPFLSAPPLIIRDVPVIASNTPATGVPTITGTVRVGETLTANTTDISDSDGVNKATFTYQWLADDADITDATGSTYTLVAADEGKTVKARITFTDDAGNDESLTSEPTAAVTASNTPATGEPTITGTAQVGETLTANTAGIADSDGLINATFTYQWLADDTDITDATGSTYTLAAADEGKTVKIRLSFTDDRGHQETLTSTATAAVTAAPSPLTVSVESAPTSHNGSEAFRIRVAFSETPESGFSYTTMRDHAFTVTGGDVTGARRLVSGKNLRWEVTVQPSGNADVTVELPVTTDCAAQGAICTDNDEKLSNSLNLTVSGPEATPPPAVVVSALTVSVESTPTSHNGSNSFRIRIALSEAPKSSFSYTTMRDHAFTVTGGDVTGARRLVSGKNLRWEITVQPSGNADVTVELPATTNCATQGAICTGNDDKLSNSLNLIVSGPN